MMMMWHTIQILQIKIHLPTHTHKVDLYTDMSLKAQKFHVISSRLWGNRHSIWMFALHITLTCRQENIAGLIWREYSIWFFIHFSTVDRFLLLFSSIKSKVVNLISRWFSMFCFIFRFIEMYCFLLEDDEHLGVVTAAGMEQVVLLPLLPLKGKILRRRTNVSGSSYFLYCYIDRTSTCYLHLSYFSLVPVIGLWPC